jgi:hypothetical protein
MEIDSCCARIASLQALLDRVGYLLVADLNTLVAEYWQEHDVLEVTKEKSAYFVRPLPCIPYTLEVINKYGNWFFHGGITHFEWLGLEDGVMLCYADSLGTGITVNFARTKNTVLRLATARSGSIYVTGLDASDHLKVADLLRTYMVKQPRLCPRIYC